MRCLPACGIRLQALYGHLELRFPVDGKKQRTLLYVPGPTQTNRLAADGLVDGCFDRSGSSLIDSTTVNPTLETRWQALCTKTGLDGSVEWQDLSAAYADPARAYHNLNHITDCLLRFDEHAHLAIDPVAVEFAIWFHDLVYDTHAADNEERSAMAAERFLSATIFGNVVGDLIRATKHHVPPGTPDAALLCDIDLSILGRSPGEYDAYARAIRQEYSWVPQIEYVKGRTLVLEAFLAKPSIFVLEELEGRYGAQGRANLLREIGTLADAVARYTAQT